MVKDNFGRIIKKKELQDVLNTMVSYKIKDGFMDFEGGNPDGKLLFFDSDPKFNGKGAVKVTMGGLLEWIIQNRN